MDNKTILLLRGNTKHYGMQALVSGCISLFMYLVGIFMVYAFYHNGQRAKRLVGNMFYTGSGDYEYSVLLIGLIIIIIGYFTGFYFFKSLNLYIKSQHTSLEINQNNIIGVANNNRFEINISDISLVDIQEFTYKTLQNGKPETFDKSLVMKLKFKTSKYLILQTKLGDTFYIDTLPSLDYAKTVINSEIASKNK